MFTDYQTNRAGEIICVLVCNLIIALLYLIYKWRKKDLESGIIMSAFMIFCPVVGPAYLFFSWLVYEIYFKRSKSHISIEELSFSKDKLEGSFKPDVREALNKVPLEEALIVSDKKSTKKLLFDMLREDNKASLQSILKAVEHKDSEVSHYAAAAISDSINEFKIREKQLREKYNEDMKNSELCNEYMEYIYNYLSQKILSIAEQRFYSGLFEEFVLKMEEYLPSEVSGEVYNKLVSLLLDLGENEKAKVWAQKAMTDFENELGSYKAALRFYYNNNDRNKFLLLLQKLKKSDVLLDHDMLEMIRFFSY